jgi:hypothetical protein
VLPGDSAGDSDEECDNEIGAESVDTSGALTLSEMDELQLYENAQYGFAVSYPPDWIAHEPDANELGMVVGFLAPDEDIDDPLDYVTVQIESLPADQKINLDYYTQAVLSNLKSSYPDFQSLAEGDMQLSDQPAHVLAYSATVDQTPYQVLVAYTIRDDKAYIVTYYALADRYSQYEDDAKEMINSFDFL